MAKLTINGQTVTVDDSFLSLSPEQQDATVDEIAASMGASGTPGEVASPSAAYEDALAGGSAASQRLQGGPGVRQQDLLGDFLGSTAATISGGVNSIPVLGPLAQRATDNLLGLGSVLTGGDYDAPQQRREELIDRHPVAYGAGNVAGSLATFGAGAATKLGAEALGVTGPVWKQAVNSGASMLGLGTADNMARGQAPMEALQNAASPAAVASVIPFVGQGVKALGGAIAKGATSGAQRKLTDAAIAGAPPSGDLRSAASALFKSSRASGVGIKADVFGNFARDLARKAKEADIDPDLDGEAFKAFDRLIALAREGIESGQGVSLSRLHNLRQIAQDVVGEATKDRTKRFGGQIVDGLDALIQNLKPNQIHLPPNRLGGSNDAANDLMQGISTWAQAKKLGVIEEAIAKAGFQKSGVENGLRLQFLSILRDPKKRAIFTKAELQAIEQVAKGTTISNITTLLGKFGFGTSNGGNMVGGSIGALLFGVPGVLAATGARQLSERMAVKGADRAAKVVGSQSPIPQAALAPNLLAPFVRPLEIGGRALAFNPGGR